MKSKNKAALDRAVDLKKQANKDKKIDASKVLNDLIERELADQLNVLTIIRDGKLVDVQILEKQIEMIKKARGLEP